MAKIPVDEVIAHLHGLGTENTVLAPKNVQVTGGGAATLDITRRADGQVSVYIALLGRGVEFRVPQQEWDRVMAVRLAQPTLTADEVRVTVSDAMATVAMLSGDGFPQRVVEDIVTCVADKLVGRLIKP